MINVERLDTMQTKVKKRILFILCGIVALAIVLTGGWFVWQYYFPTKVVYTMTKNVEQTISTKAPELPYDLDFQKTVKAELDQKKAEKDYTIDQPLVVLNPYGTNVLSAYVYFNTERKALMEYTVSSAGVPDFTQTAYTEDASGATTHEYQIIGLTPEAENTITIRMKNKQNRILYEKQITVTAPKMMSATQKKLEKETVTEGKELSEGLYLTIGPDFKSPNRGSSAFYDNDGYIRGEIPVNENYRIDRLTFRGNQMLYTYDNNVFAVVNRLGMVEDIYQLTGYTMHHDYTLTDDGKLIILASKDGAETVEDRIICYDPSTRKTTELVDMAKLLPDYKKITSTDKETLDWIHFNSVTMLSNDTAVFSSRETSTIMKIKDLFNNPTIDYMIGDESIWEDFSYKNLLLKKEGDFVSQAGQHSVTYQPDESLPEGQYYLYMYNNNYGAMTTRRSYDWSNIPGVGDFNKGEKSMAYKYLVDEKAKTYQLVWSKDVAYSPIVSATQQMDNGNYVIESGCAKVFQECTKDGQTIANFKVDVKTYFYRVYKYTMKNFWFQG